MSRIQASPFNAALLMLLVLVLAGCGFQLRGAESAPEDLRPIAFSCDRSVPSDLCQGVREQLELNGLLAENDEEAYQLRLGNYRRDRRVSAITDRAAAAEYELTTQSFLSLSTADGVPLFNRVRLQAGDAYRTDETRVLSEEGERASIEARLHERMAGQVVNRLRPWDQDRIDAVREVWEQQQEDL